MLYTTMVSGRDPIERTHSERSLQKKMHCHHYARTPYTMNSLPVSDDLRLVNVR
jgi:hypothetical protein